MYPMSYNSLIDSNRYFLFQSDYWIYTECTSNKFCDIQKNEIVISQDDFARAAKVVSGQDLSHDCVWVVFKMFDTGGDGKLQHEELLDVTRDRLRRLPGQRDAPPGPLRFLHCVRGD